MLRFLMLVIVMFVSILLLVSTHEGHDHDHEHGHKFEEPVRHDDEDDDDEPPAKSTASDLPKLDPEEVEYHKGSLCGYCEYCKVSFQL